MQWSSLRRNSGGWKLCAIGLAGAAIGISACGGDDADSGKSTSRQSGAAAQDLKRVTCRMGYTWAGGLYYSGYLIGVAKGIYAKHGLDVEFQQGTGSATSVQLVANGRSDFGCAIGTGAVINTVSGGAPVKAIAGTMPVSTLSTMSPKAAPITKPQDLIGHSIGLPPGGEQEQLWPAFLKANNLNAKDIKVVSAAGDSLIPSVKAGRIDSFVASWLQVPTLKGAGVDAARLDWADYGVKYEPLEGLIAPTKLIESDPETVQKFVDAVKETWEYAIANPDETAKYYVSQHPELQEPVVRAQLGLVIDMLKSQGGPFANTNEQTWGDAVKLLTEYAGLKNPKPAAEYFTDQFVQ